MRSFWSHTIWWNVKFALRKLICSSNVWLSNVWSSNVWYTIKSLILMHRNQKFDYVWDIWARCFASKHLTSIWKKQIRRFIKLYAIKTSHFNHSMRIESISFIFASLNSAHRVLQSWSFEELNMLFRMWFWVWCALILDTIVEISVLILFFK